MNLLHDDMEMRETKKLADVLGVSIDDLDGEEYEIYNNSSDDGLIYEYIVKFDEYTSKDFLLKVGADNNRCVGISANAFD